MNSNLRKTLLAGASVLALVVGGGTVFADSAGTSVTQTATHLDAAASWIGQTNGVTSCNSVSATSPSATITITPPAGQYVYLTAILLQRSSDATGVTEVPTIATTNISSNGGATGAVLSAAMTLSTVGATNTGAVIPFGIGGLKSAAPGVAVTFVPSGAQATHGILCMSAVGYYNAN